MSRDRLSVTMFTSWQDRCGIAAYARGMVAELQRAVDVRVVPARFERLSGEEYRSLGEAMNAGQVAHVQHSYAFWGGMRPPGTGYAAFMAAIRAPVVLTIHEIDTGATGAGGLSAPAAAAYKGWFNRRAFLAPPVRHWIVHTDPLRRTLCDLGAPAERVHLLPMPVPEPPPVEVNPVEARRMLGLEGKRVLTIFGFLARRKGYELAVEALSRLGPEYVLVCAGGEHPVDRTGTEAWLRSLARAAGVEDRVRITGFLPEDDLPRAMAATDLVLAPFTRMAGSASLHLAVGYRKPVLASDLPPNRELPCVALFPAGDARALEREIAVLTADSAALAHLSAAADRFARDHGYPALARQTLAIYQDAQDRD